MLDQNKQRELFQSLFILSYCITETKILTLAVSLLGTQINQSTRFCSKLQLCHVVVLYKACARLTAQLSILN